VISRRPRRRTSRRGTADPTWTGPARRRRGVALALAAIASIATAGLVDLTGALDTLERATITSRFALRHVPRPTGIVIVKIDDQTFDELGRPWPFPRSLHGRVIDRLHAAGAKEIVYDVQFTEPTTAAQDLALYHAIGRAGDVTLATSESDGEGHTNVLGGDANLARVHARAGAANLTTSSGGVVTGFPYEVSGLTSLAVVAAERATNIAVPASRFSDGQAWIDYRGGDDTFPSVSYWAVLRGQVPASELRGKIVIVGATAPTLQDLHSTPVSGSELMSGPEVQANAIWTAIHHNPLRSAPRWLALIAILLAATIPALASIRLGVLRSMFAAIVAAGAYLVTAQLAFNAGCILAVTSPLVALGIGTSSMVAAHYFTASADRRLLGWTVRRRTEQLRDAQLEIVTRLAQAAESRDMDTGQHIERIGHLCERLALRVGLGATQAQLLRHASAMHDIGKIGIPDRVLLKPGSLDDEEWTIMRTHTTIGAEILAGSTSPLVQMAEVIARTHHERWDGTGYPQGLRGEQIPLIGRICAVCDVFDALISARPYKHAWPRAAALDAIAKGRGSQFDPALVDAFLGLPSEDHHDPPSNLDHLTDTETLPPLLELATARERR
jgi:CHASE2 domain-containing sensor protein